MKNIASLKLGAALAVCAVVAQPIIAAPLNPVVESAKKVFAQYQDSVLWVSARIKINISAEGQDLPEREQKVMILGTVVGSNGLLVTTATAIDPSREISGREVQTRDGGRTHLEASVEVKEVQIVMPDGLEVPAEIVYKDTDQDLAFIRAKADSKEFASAKFKALDLKDNAKTAIAEETISIGRADEVLGRQPSVGCGQVNAILTKPHVFYRISSAGLGTPTFDADGKLIGIGVVHRLGTKGSISVVMPAADIVAIAEQAKNAKPIAAEKSEKSEKADKSGEKSADKN